jgi:hypothetical protein
VKRTERFELELDFPTRPTMHNAFYASTTTSRMLSSPLRRCLRTGLSAPYDQAPSRTHTNVNRMYKAAATPLPKTVLACLFLGQICEYVAATACFPWIQSALLEYGIVKDKVQVGRYAGLVESTFFVCEAIFILRICRFSDRVGRKPVLILSAAGQALSALGLGFATTLPGMMAAR